MAAERYAMKIVNIPLLAILNIIMLSCIKLFQYSFIIWIYYEVFQIYSFSRIIFSLQISSALQFCNIFSFSILLQYIVLFVIYCKHLIPASPDCDQLRGGRVRGAPSRGWLYVAVKRTWNPFLLKALSCSGSHLSGFICCVPGGEDFLL